MLRSPVNHFMMLQSWDPCVTLNPAMEIVPVWVRFPNLPKFYWPFIKHIASCMGKVISPGDESSYAASGTPRICILTSSKDKLPGVMDLQHFSGEGTISQVITYDGLPNQCRRCLGFGHWAKQCHLNSKGRGYKKPMHNG